MADTSVGVISFSVWVSIHRRRDSLPGPVPRQIMSLIIHGYELFSAVDSLLEDIMLFGDLLEALKVHNPKKKNNIFKILHVCFPGGSQELSDEILATYKNQGKYAYVYILKYNSNFQNHLILAVFYVEGGYDLLGRMQDQIKITEQKLDALVIIGGIHVLDLEFHSVTSNTDAAQLAETFAERNCPTKVIGIPVTLNGDLKNQFVETNVNSQLISHVATDALSIEKYYYFN
ncbi:hypothetical protein ACS0TY_013003 [Phlomoides rotata]